MASPSSRPPVDQPHDVDCLSIAELEHHASRRMTKGTRDYYNEGADWGSTLKENNTAYAKYRIRPRVLRDISLIDMDVEVFGEKVEVPIGAAPTAMQCLAHEDGEVATAKACGRAGWAMGLSSFATKTLEEVTDALASASASTSTEGAVKPTEGRANANETRPKPPQAIQLYLFEEREHSRKLIQRAKKAGFKAVFLTVDTPMLGRRNGDIRNDFKLPKSLRIANFAPSEEKHARKDAEAVSHGGTSAQAESCKGYFDGAKRRPPSGPISFHTHAANPTLSWDQDIAWLKEECGPEMQLWIKGLATAEDAILAVHHGLDGIIVSNHGGRQLNGALATIDALPEVVEAVRGKIPVHVDGGIRHGTDVFKALALGADFVWIGRPVLWGLAYKGQEGVEHCLRLISDEFRLCMGLAGTINVKDITKDYLAKVDRGGFVSRL